MTTRMKWGVAIGGGLVLLVGAYVVRATWFPPRDEADKLLADLRAKSEQERFAEMRNLREKAEKLSEAEQEKLREGMLAMFESAMDERVNEYADAPEEAQVAILDKHIDEMLARRAEFEAQREARRAEREREHAAAGQGGTAEGGPGPRDSAAPPPPDGDPPPEGGPPPGGASPPGDGARASSQPGNGAQASGQRRGPGMGRGAPSRAERKQRMESSNPDREARRMRYFNAIRERAKERGIEMGGPGGRGGRGGGPGRGPGGPGGA